MMCSKYYVNRQTTDAYPAACTRRDGRAGVKIEEDAK